MDSYVVSTLNDKQNYNNRNAQEHKRPSEDHFREC